VFYDETPAPLPHARQLVRNQLLVTGLISFAAGGVLIYTALTTRVPPSYSVAGPTFIPKLVGIGFLMIGAAMFFRAWREWDAGRASAPFDLKGVGALLAVMLLLPFVLVPVGWVLSAATLFAIASAVFGSQRHVVNFVIGIAVSVATQVLFVSALGLRLPLGVLSFLPH
jgi:putative tricarboxylic transport membrane protein